MFLFYRNSNITAVVEGIKSISGWVFAVFTISYMVAFWLQVMKWRLLLPEVSFYLVLKASMYGKFFMVALPGQLFGEAAKMVVFGKDTSDYNKSVSSVVIDKITGMVALFLTGIFGFVFTKTILPGGFLILIVSSMAIILIALFSFRITIVYTVLLKILDKIESRISKVKNIVEKIKGFLAVWQSYIKNPNLIFISILYGIIFNAVMVAQYELICYCLNIHINIFDLCWIISMLSVILLIPITFAGIGLRDATLVGMFAILGIASDKAISMSLIFLIFTVLMALCGGVFVFWDMIKKKRT